MDGTYGGRQLLRSIKETSGSSGSQLVLPVGDPLVAYLRPVSMRKDRQNKEDLAFLTTSRNKYPYSFLTVFDATIPQTSDWLANYVNLDDTRIIFMLDLLNGRTVGYMGLAFINWEEKYGEADAIVRGAPAPKGLMTTALHALLSWAQGQLGLKRIGVRVLSDNPALKFYQRVGFVEEKRISLSRKEEGGKVIWFEDEGNINPSRLLVYHILQKR